MKKIPLKWLCLILTLALVVSARAAYLGRNPKTLIEAGAMQNYNCSEFKKCLGVCAANKECREQCKSQAARHIPLQSCQKKCGKIFCEADEVCCNESCSICTKPGEFCIQLFCN